MIARCLLRRTTSYCCTTAWDSICVGEVLSVCHQSCGGGSTCSHAICTTGKKLTSTYDGDICSVDSYCCNTNWDSTCVSEVGSICGESCNQEYAERVASWSLFDYDWRRIARWCLLGAIVMCLWLLAPVAKCSYYAFRDIPLDETDTAPIDPTKADQQRVDDSKSFVGGWVHATKYCYRRTPLFDQEPWKTNVLFAFTGVMVLGFTLHRLRKR